MPFDFNILCMNQKKKSELPFSSQFLVRTHHRNNDDYPKHYQNKWHFMNSCCGFWYDLLPMEIKYGKDSYTGVYYMCHDIYRESSLKKNEYLPKKLVEYTEHELHWVVSIKDELVEDFCKVIDFYLQESPVNMIIFLARYEDVELDLVTGVIEKSAFYEMLRHKELMFNMSYIIRGS